MNNPPIPEPDDLSYSLDLVLCVDSTASMIPALCMVADSIDSLAIRLSEAFFDMGKALLPEALRVKVIQFKDYCWDKEPMTETRFFRILKNEERQALCEFVDSMLSYGGGDEPESGLEALAASIRADWSPAKAGNRQIIVLFTDASTHDLDDPLSKQHPLYPKDMHTSLDALQVLWEEGDPAFAPHYDPSRARLILFAPPEVFPWKQLQFWSRTSLYPVQEARGCSELDFSVVYSMIAGIC